MTLTVLADAAHGESQPGVPVLVLDEDVGAVSLQRDVVVTGVDDAVSEGDVVGVDDVRAVGLHCCQLRKTSGDRLAIHSETRTRSRPLGSRPCC